MSCKRWNFVVEYDEQVTVPHHWVQWYQMFRSEEKSYCGLRPCLPWYQSGDDFPACLFLMCMHDPGAVFSVISPRSWRDAFAIWATTSPSSYMTMWLALFWPNTNWSSPFCCVPTCCCKYWSTECSQCVTMAGLGLHVNSFGRGWAGLAFCLCAFCRCFLRMILVLGNLWFLLWFGSWRPRNGVRGFSLLKCCQKDCRHKYSSSLNWTPPPPAPFTKEKKTRKCWFGI